MEGRYSSVAEDGGFIVVLRDITKRKAAEEGLAALNVELSHLASSDGLTGLANRRRFDEAMEAEWHRARRDGTPVSLLLLDVDRFKVYNDLYGHQEGDACLQAIAVAARSVVRRSGDLVARYGGEELAVVLPGADEAAVAATAERIRGAIAGLARPHPGNPGCGSVVTASLGCATLRPAADRATGPEALIAVADARLYEAKRTGRNRVVSALPPAVATPPVVEEERRLAVLATYDVAGRVEELDVIARLAALLFGAPIGLVSIVGQEDVVLAGRHGIDLRSLPRHGAYCSHTIQGDDPLVVQDTRADSRFAAIATAEGGFGFYAGAPLISPVEGRRLGALCIADTCARPPLDARQRDILAGLARLAMESIERRRLSSGRHGDAAPSDRSRRA